MYRYIALSWDHTIPAAASAARMIAARINAGPLTWNTAFDSPGLLVLHTDPKEGCMQAYPIIGKDGRQRGVVTGKLFDRPTADDQPMAPNAHLDKAQSQRILDSRGQALIDHHWGRYVAFVHDEQSNERWVVRDPIGQFSCHYIPHQGVDIFFSDMETIADFEFLDLSLDWENIGLYLKYLFLIRSSTCYKKVTQLMPGERLSIMGDKRIIEQLWDPATISQTNMIEDVEEAARLLRTMTMNCVAAWAGNYERILHRIGGLDSSIVLACLTQMDNPPDITCFTYYTTGALDGDERVYVRMATEHMDVSLFEQERSISKINMARFKNVYHSPIPENYFHAVELSDFECDLAKKTRAQASFTGIGGDQVYMAPVQNHGPSDYIKTKGININMFKYIIESAQIQNISIWKSLKNTLFDFFSEKKFDAHTNNKLTNSPLINQNIAEPIKNIEHWFDSNNQKIPNGKKHHLYFCSLSLDYRGLFLPPQHVTPVDPIMSQPLLELCFRIPTWLLAKNGMQRGLARYAFAEYLPREIICRESKSSAISYYKNIISKERVFLRHYLMEGFLSKNKLINHELIDKYLSDDKAISEVPIISALINIESWIQSNSKLQHSI